VIGVNTANARSAVRRGYGIVGAYKVGCAEQVDLARRAALADQQA